MRILDLQADFFISVFFVYVHFQYCRLSLLLWMFFWTVILWNMPANNSVYLQIFHKISLSRTLLIWRANMGNMEITFSIKSEKVFFFYFKSDENPQLYFRFVVIAYKIRRSTNAHECRLLTGYLRYILNKLLVILVHRWERCCHECAVNRSKRKNKKVRNFFFVFWKAKSSTTWNGL